MKEFIFISSWFSLMQQLPIFLFHKHFPSRGVICDLVLSHPSVILAYKLVKVYHKRHRRSLYSAWSCFIYLRRVEITRVYKFALKKKTKIRNFQGSRKIQKKKKSSFDWPYMTCCIHVHFIRLIGGWILEKKQKISQIDWQFGENEPVSRFPSLVNNKKCNLIKKKRREDRGRERLIHPCKWLSCPPTSWYW